MKSLLTASFLFMSASLSSLLGAPAQGTVLPLWPGQPSGETAPAKPEEHRPDTKGNILRITNVWTPTLEIFPVPADNNTGAAVLICPGGGYSILAYDKEGTDIARWLNTQGVTGVVLKYRVPTRPKARAGNLPLKDAQRALSLLRANATTWKIDPDRVGIMGFSAGGHLAALTSTTTTRTYDPIDDTDQLSCAPNFTVLVYPAYCVEKGKLSSRLPVDGKTPPALLIHAANDPHTMDSSLLYFSALRTAKVPAELHIYSTGGHGYGMRDYAHPSATWPACLAAWLKTEGWLSVKKNVSH